MLEKSTSPPRLNLEPFGTLIPKRNPNFSLNPDSLPQTGKTELVCADAANGTIEKMIKKMILEKISLVITLPRIELPQFNNVCRVML